jgi:hypothetical protein
MDIPAAQFVRRLSIRVVADDPIICSSISSGFIDLVACSHSRLKKMIGHLNKSG